MKTIEVRQDYLKSTFSKAQETERLIELMIFNLSQAKMLSPRTREDLEAIRKGYAKFVGNTVRLITETSTLVDLVLTDDRPERAKEQAIVIASIINELRS